MGETSRLAIVRQHRGTAQVHFHYSEYGVDKGLLGGMGFRVLGGTGVPVSAVGPDIVYGHDIAKNNASLARLAWCTGNTGPSRMLERAAADVRK